MMSDAMNLTGQQATGALNLFFDMKENVSQRTDDRHAKYEVTAAQLPMMLGISLTDIRMTKDHIQEPHWHPNAGELVYLITGEVTVSVLDPAASELLTYRVKPGQVVFLPIGWWHWVNCTSEEAHLLMVYNQGSPLSAKSSDVLRLTPLEVFQQAYCVKGSQLAKIMTPAEDETDAVRTEVVPKAASLISPNSSAEGPTIKKPAKKASNIRNSSSTASLSSSSLEPAVWRPPIPGLQVRIGSTVHNS